MTDKKNAIWNVCNEMMREGKERREITGRKVASRKEIEWSHTTVTPYVTAWHDDRTKQEQEMLSKTSMSVHFVKALRAEVEDRVNSLRKIDAEQSEAMAVQLSDMVAENEVLENQLEELKSELEKKTELLGSLTTNLEQLQKSQQAIELEMKENTAKWESKAEKLATEHSSSLADLNNKHSESIEKLNTRLDDKSKEISDLNAKLALAELKASEHDKLKSEVESANTKISSITNENMKLVAEMNATKDTVQTLTESLDDTKEQRDKAQQSSEAATAKLEAATAKLEEIQQKWTDSLLAASNHETSKGNNAGGQVNT